MHKYIIVAANALKSRKVMFSAFFVCNSSVIMEEPKQEIIDIDAGIIILSVVFKLIL